MKRRAHELGFDLVGIAPAERPTHADFYVDWLERGHGGTMNYLARPDAVARRLDPASALSGARSIILVALNYHNRDDGPVDDPARPVVARYARGTDYHDIFEEKLEALIQSLRAIIGSDVHTRAYVDYGPVLERDHAQRAGLGWIGKNTVLINPRLGSYLFLGEILTDAELAFDEPFVDDRCGTCARCIAACPTGAIKGPRDLDARLCISYLTIELRGPIPRDLRPLIGNRVFGCDICQEVCPWNEGVPETKEPRLRPRDDITGAELIELMGLGESEFEERFSDTPLERTRRRGLLRNVAVALGNWADPRAVPALTRGLHDDEPLVRGHSAWALGRIATERAGSALTGRLVVETEEWVRSELEAALEDH
ncbi:MAG: tRNA epoxyqueuosine(34) reductase QueG [Candidatus Palauibacterales bacterium]|nr:tRNA epoxyqueuosine(34) reductase QueG [Candidatus Palauibacterales bacterium]